MFCLIVAQLLLLLGVGQCFVRSYQHTISSDASRSCNKASQGRVEIVYLSVLKQKRSSYRKYSRQQAEQRSRTANEEQDFKDCSATQTTSTSSALPGTRVRRIEISLAMVTGAVAGTTQARSY
jgi:hypothetical protein